MNSSNQQVHIAVQQYIQYTMVCSHVASNYVLFAESGDTTSLFANKEGSSSERCMEGGIADETSMSPLKCAIEGPTAVLVPYRSVDCDTRKRFLFR